MSLNIHATPYTQFPLRLDHNLHQRFNNIAASTKIPKSILGRLGITKLLNEIDEKGITRVLQELEK
jgi:predicted DNA-binding protein